MASWRQRVAGWLPKFSAVGPSISAILAGQPQYPPRRYDQIADEAFTRNVVAFQCVDMVARAFASLQILVTKNEDEQENHPLKLLLDQPNPMQSRGRWLHSMAAWHLLTGNSYVEAGEGSGLNRGPSELWLLRPDRVRVVPGDYGLPQGYQYEVNGQTRQFNVDPLTGRGPILHMKEFHPLNDWYGLSPAEVTAIWLDIDNQAATLNWNLLKAGGHPQGIFSLDGPTAAPMWRETEDKVHAQWTRTATEGRPLLLQGKWQWQQIAQSLKEMQWSEVMAESARRICAAWNVPHILIVPGESTYANREQANLELWERTVIPFAKTILPDLTGWFRHLYGEEDLDLVVDEDSISALEPRRADKRDAILKNYQGGLITKNEAREELDYDPVPEGDDFNTMTAAQQLLSGGIGPDGNPLPKPLDPNTKPGVKPGNGGGQTPGKPKPGKPKPGKKADDDLVPAELELVPDAKGSGWMLQPRANGQWVRAGSGQGFRISTTLGTLSEEGLAAYIRGGVPLVQLPALPAVEPPDSLTVSAMGLPPAGVVAATAPIPVPVGLAGSPGAAGKALTALPTSLIRPTSRLVPDFFAGKADNFDLSQEVDDELMVAALLPVVAEILSIAGQAQLNDLDTYLAFDVRQALVEDWLAGFAGEQVVGIGDTTRKAVREALVTARAEAEADGSGGGIGLAEAIAVISAVFAEASKARGPMIARTETTRAVGFGGHVAMLQAKVDRRMWLSQRDTRVRHAHVVLDGQTVNVDEPFDYSGHKAMYPGGFNIPSLDLNCRCYTVPIPVAKSDLAMTLSTEEGRANAWEAQAAAWAPAEARLLDAVQLGFVRQETRLIASLGKASR